MWPSNRDRTTKRLNTVDLKDDLSDVEIVQAIGETFGFSIHSNEAGSVVNVGDLYDLVKSNTPKDSDFDPICPRSAAISRARLSQLVCGEMAKECIQKCL